MTALRALELTNKAGYDYVMDSIRDRCRYGFDYVELHSDVVERFKNQLLANGYTISNRNTRISWGSPITTSTPFNQ